MIEVSVTRNPALAGAEGVGWWDFPHAPDTMAEIQDDYRYGRAAQHRDANTPQTAP
ncbi:hypothetical protein [Jannaschia sp. CCS1]|uniref:hypothetical protein n=1 Tax=Jannaschia sp. (strain CCS1) TaxID=290400 RepID=UPI000310F88C|nr:hypothetical protein [Jannaschia sp. CCS1]